MRLWQLKVFFLLFVLSCTIEADAPRRRPRSVPAHAMWIGGADGGVFVLVNRKEGAPQRTYNVAIYNDFTGDVWFKGRMTLSAPGELNASALRDPKSFGGWDGERLFLADGRYLAASVP